MDTISNIAGTFARNLGVMAVGVISYDLVIGGPESVPDEIYYAGLAASGIAFAVLYTIYDLCRRQG